MSSYESPPPPRRHLRHNRHRDRLSGKPPWPTTGNPNDGPKQPQHQCRNERPRHRRSRFRIECAHTRPGDDHGTEMIAITLVHPETGHAAATAASSATPSAAGCAVRRTRSSAPGSRPTRCSPMRPRTSPPRISAWPPPTMASTSRSAGPTAPATHSCASGPTPRRGSRPATPTTQPTNWQAGPPPCAPRGYGRRDQCTFQGQQPRVLLRPVRERHRGAHAHNALTPPPRPVQRVAFSRRIPPRPYPCKLRRGTGLFVSPRTVGAMSSSAKLLELELRADRWLEQHLTANPAGA